MRFQRAIFIVNSALVLCGCGDSSKPEDVGNAVSNNVEASSTADQTNQPESKPPNSTDIQSLIASELRSVAEHRERKSPMPSLSHGLRDLVWRKSITQSQILLVNALEPQELSPADSLLIELLAITTLEQTLDRFDGVPGECFLALAASRPKTPRADVFSNVTGGSRFGQVVDSQSSMRLVVETIETFRDLDSQSGSPDAKAAIERAKAALTIRSLSWGGKEPPEIHEVVLADVMLGGGLGEVGEEIKKELRPADSFGAENHMRLFRRLSAKAGMNGKEVLAIVRTTLDAQTPRGVLVDDRLWAAERVLAQLTIAKSNQPKRVSESTPAPVAPTTAGSKLLDEAAKSLGELASTKDIDEQIERDGLLAELAALQAQSGNLDGAWHTTRSLDPSSTSEYFSALQEIAVAEAAAGNIAKAIETAGQIKDARKRCRALAGIGQVQLIAKDGAGAERSFGAVREASKDAINPAECLECLIQAYALAGDMKSAVAVAAEIDKIPESDRRGVSPYLRLAVLQAEVGEVRDSWDTYESHGGNADGALLAMVKAFLRHQQVDLAESCLSAFVSPEFRSQAICEVALEHARVGRDDVAKKILTLNGAAYSQIRRDQYLWKSNAAAANIAVIAELDGFIEANSRCLATASELPEGFDGEFYRRLAEVAARQGRQEKADAYFSRAAQHLQRISDDAEEKPLMLRELAMSQVRARGAESILVWAKDIPSPLTRSRVLIGAASGLNDTK